MDERVESAVRLFSQGSSCSQAILTAFGPQVGLDSELAHKMGAGLGAGFGRKQYLCGAISAGAIVLSLRFGNTHAADTATKERAYAAVHAFITAMESDFGSSSCREILGVSIETPEMRQTAQRQGLFDTVCRDCVRRVAEYLSQGLDAPA